MQSYAGGGIASLAAGGAMAGQSYPQGLLNSNQYSLPTSSPTSNEVVSGGYEPEINTYTGARVGPGMAEGGVARLSFGYTIVSPGNHDIDGLNKNENFHTIMGDILTEILIAKAEDEQIRTDYSKEFNTQ
jgi:hypothetical protein